MRALLFQGPDAIAYTADQPEPEVVDDCDAVVALEGAGLCGSDLHPYLGREPARPGVIPGHEGIGQVISVGGGVERFGLGDRVIIPFTTSCGRCPRCRAGLTSRCVCGELFGWGDPDNATHVPLQGMQAEMVRVPMADATLVGAPESVSTAQGLLLGDNLPTGWYAVKRSELTHRGRLVILGAGSVGLCSLVAAFHAGATEVFVLDPIEERRRVASNLGAIALAPDDAAVEAIGPVESLVDTAGSRAAQKMAADLAAPGATLSMIAVQTEPHLGFDPVDIYDRNLTIRSGRAPVRTMLDEILPLVSTGDLDVPDDLIFTDEALSLSDGPAVYRRFADRAGGIIKAWFDPRR